MIILEYMILATSLIGAWLLWDLRLRVLSLQDTQDQLIQETSKLIQELVSKDDFNHLYTRVKDNFQEVRKDFTITWDRFDDLQRSILTKTDFDKYLADLRDKENILQEAQKKIKENRNKSLRIAFGGKEDE